jgi:hypothetical protein
MILGRGICRIFDVVSFSGSLAPEGPRCQTALVTTINVRTRDGNLQHEFGVDIGFRSRDIEILRLDEPQKKFVYDL